MNSSLILVDGNNYAHRAYHAYKKLWHKDFNVAVIYGMPSMINSMLFKHRPTKLIIVWDGEKSKHRLRALPSYKGHRRVVNKSLMDYDQFQLQKAIVRKMFYYLGIPQVLNPEAEGDDMIYKFCKMGKKKFGIVRIASGDKDFNQLISERVEVINDNKKNIIHLENCKEIFGYHPSQCVDYISLVGDDSDDIPGYPGMGDKRTRELLEKYGSIEDFLESGDSFSIIDRNKLLEIKKRNEFLINLPVFYRKHKSELKTVFFKDESDPEINPKLFLKVCKKYRMNKLMGSSFQREFKKLK